MDILNVLYNIIIGSYITWGCILLASVAGVLLGAVELSTGVFVMFTTFLAITAVTFFFGWSYAIIERERILRQA